MIKIAMLPLALVCVLMGLAVYGLCISILLLFLGLRSNVFRDWLRNRPRVQRFGRVLPGLCSSSPRVLALSTSGLVIVISFAALLLLVPADVTYPGPAAPLLRLIVGGVGLILWMRWSTGGDLAQHATVANSNSGMYSAFESSRAYLRGLVDIKTLDPVEFEYFVGGLFAGMGYSVAHTKATGDEGVDLDITRGDRHAIVQCKRYYDVVGQPEVRNLLGALVHTGAQEAFLVTTGRFSLPAMQWARGKPIHLVDGTELMEWVRGSVERAQSDIGLADSQGNGGTVSPPSTQSEARQRHPVLGDALEHLLSNWKTMCLLLFALTSPFLCVAMSYVLATLGM